MAIHRTKSHDMVTPLKLMRIRYSYPTPKRREEGKPAYIFQGTYFNFLESTVHGAFGFGAPKRSQKGADDGFSRSILWCIWLLPKPRSRFDVRARLRVLRLYMGFLTEIPLFRGFRTMGFLIRFLHCQGLPKDLN